MGVSHPEATDDRAVHSAQGTRLNRRGIESRRRFLAVAIETLAEEGPAAASANLVAKRAGVTWGTVQHQFGDADGVWAAMVDELASRVEVLDVQLPPADASLRRRVDALIQRIWQGYGTRESRAVENLRLALPRDHDALMESFPKTAASFRRFDGLWADLWSRVFADLDVSATRLRRVRSLVPAAVRGLQMDADLLTFAQPEEGLKALVDGVVAYLEPAR